MKTLIHLFTAILPFSILLNTCCSTNAAAQPSSFSHQYSNSSSFKTLYSNGSGKLVVPNNSKQKPIYVHVFSESCGGCIHMEKYVYAQDEIAQKLKDEFVLIKVDGEQIQNTNFKQYHRIIQYPTLLFLQPDGITPILKIDHAISAEEMMQEIDHAKQLMQGNNQLQAQVTPNTPTLPEESYITPPFTPISFPKAPQKEKPTTSTTPKYTIPQIPNVVKPAAPQETFIEPQPQQQPAIKFVTSAPAVSPIITTVAQSEKIEEKTKPLFTTVAAEKKQNNTRIDLLKQKYEQGDRSAELLRTYAYEMRAAGRNYNKVVNDYLKLSQNRKNPDLDREFIYDFATNLSNDAIQVFAQNAKEYKRYYSGTQINQKIKSAIYTGITSGAKVRDISVLEKAKKIAQIAQLPDVNFLMFEMNLVYFDIVQDWKMYAQTAYNYLKTNTESLSGDPQALNEIANNIIKCSDCNKKLYKFALQLAQYSTKIENEYYNNTTCAEIYLLLDNHKKATRYANIACSIAAQRKISNKNAQNIKEKIQKR